MAFTKAPLTYTKDMFHRLPFLFTFYSVVVMTLAALIGFGISEMLGDAIRTQPNDRFLVEHEEIVRLRDTPLPNYWLWYRAQDLTDFLSRYRRVDVLPLIYLTLFNAAANTWIVAMWQMSVLMFLLFKVVRRDSKLLLLWVLPLIVMLFDLGEDLAMLVILLNHPLKEFAELREVVAWCSCLKFVGWGILLAIEAAAAVLWVQRRSLDERKRATD